MVNRFLYRVVLAGAVALAATPGRADDSTAALAAGGLVLTHAADIRMAKEDLSVAPHLVRVHFEFVNDSAHDIDTIVAFPLPDIDTKRFYVEPLGTMTNDPVNFVGFSVMANGRPVVPTVERRAFYQGKDVTAVVAATRLPVDVVIQKNINLMEKLSPAQIRILEDAGLADHDMGGGIERPHWVVRTKFWWHQRFPAGKTVTLDHSYRPVTGASFFVRQYLDAKPDPAGAAVIRDYCIDKPTLAGIAAAIASNKGGNHDSLEALATDYILMSGNNWKGRIGRFHLTLDKEKPDPILSLCWDGALKKTGPTKFEAVRDNFAPTRDIKLLVLETYSQTE